MDSRGAIKAALASSDMIVNAYLGDLADGDLLVRVMPGINHIAWQLGHCIASEHQMINGLKPGSMPELPAGFAAKHTKETATSDDPKAFCTKAEYVATWQAQRAATLKALEACSDDELSKASPEAFRAYAPTVASVYLMQGSHYLMHAGQWAVVRRKLGRAPLF